MKDKADHDLYIFTNEYPYGTGETFIENELTILSGQFQTIYLFPLQNTGRARAIPVENTKVVYLFKERKINKWDVAARNFFRIAEILLFEMKCATSFFKFMRLLPSYRSRLITNMDRSEVLKKYMDKTDVKNVVFYSFWTDDWATVLSILKWKNDIPGFISRVHGYDLYEERWPFQRIPFRNLHLKYVSKILAASKDGMHYMQSNYPAYHEKFALSHMNTCDNGINPFYEDDEFVIVSCSSIVPLKRVYLIPELLKKVPFKTRWVHFGDGTGMKQLKEQTNSLPAHVIVELMGNVENSEVIRFYQTVKVNLFILLSETEGGVPLALQEAASFGIPLLGTDAGGIPEIVNARTGILLEKKSDFTELVNIVVNFKSSSKNSPDFRNGVRQFWSETYSPEINHLKLYNYLNCKPDDF